MAVVLKKEEQYIIDESPEISIGEALGWTNKILNIFPALKNKNYRLYFFGQLISLIGTWLQIVAEGWLVLQLTNSAFLIGLVTAAATLPTLIFSLFGGVIVDKFPKRKILVITQLSSMILAMILGLLVSFHLINVTEIMVLAFLLGVVTAIDSPARQAFVVEMVGKEHLSSAIALNSGVYNGARVIGPSIAGFLIALIGIGGAYIINSLSFIAAIIALLLMKVMEKKSHNHLHPLAAIKEGLQYSFGHPILRMLFFFTAVNSIFGWSYTTIMPLIAKNTFHFQADGLGYLYTASGIGALVSTVIVSAYSSKVNPFIFIFGGNLLFVVVITLFSFIHYLPFALIILLIYLLIFFISQTDRLTIIN